MDKYSYLLISVFMFFVWIFILFIRNDLKVKIIKSGFYGGFAGIVSEFWFYKDYWQPPSMVDRYVASFEDFAFGFLITGISVSIYDVIFTAKSIRQEKRRKPFFGFMFLMGLLLLLIFNNWFGFNSIFVCSIIFIFFSVIMLFIRNDLLIPSIISGLLVILIMLPIYIVIFNLISPNYWNTYWLLSKTKFGVMFFGNIPATEFLWYFSWGSFAGISNDFISGNKKIVKFMVSRTYIKMSRIKIL